MRNIVGINILIINSMVHDSGVSQKYDICSAKYQSNLILEYCSVDCVDGTSGNRGRFLWNSQEANQQVDYSGNDKSGLCLLWSVDNSKAFHSRRNAI